MELCQALTNVLQMKGRVINVGVRFEHETRLPCLAVGQCVQVGSGLHQLLKTSAVLFFYDCAFLEEL
jgi:hypothetical protein